MNFEDEVITSVSNSKIKFALSLRSNRNRSQLGCFLIEGFRELDRYVSSTSSETKKGSFLYMPLCRLFVCKNLLIGSNNETLIEKIRSQGTKITYVSEYVFSSKLSSRDRPDGLLGIARIEHRDLSNIVLNDNPMICVLDGIEKPGNMGSILRSADSAGIDSVIVSSVVTDIWNPRTIRSSVGSLFCVDCLQAECGETLRFLRENKITIVATSPHANVSIADYDWTYPFAIVLGSEQFGISEFWKQNADASVSLPMFGICDSLNVGAAAAVFFYFARLAREKIGSKSI